MAASSPHTAFSTSLASVTQYAAIACLSMIFLFHCHPQYLSWINDGKLAWTMTQPGLGPDTITEISGRPIPQEPLVSILNFIHRTVLTRRLPLVLNRKSGHFQWLHPCRY